MSREQPARNRWDIEIFWEIRRKVQKNEGVDCAIGGRTGTFFKDRAGHALLSVCSTNERSAFIAVPLPFRGEEDKIGGSAIPMRLPRGLVTAGAFDICTRAILSENFAISHFSFLRFWCFDLRGFCSDP